MELRGWILGGTQQLAKVKIPDSEQGSARKWGRGMRALGSLSRFCPSETPEDSWLQGFSQRGIQMGPITGTPSFYGASEMPQLNPKQGMDSTHISFRDLISTSHSAPHPHTDPYLIRAWSTLEERREAKRRAIALGDVLGLPSESPLSSSPMALM